MCIVLYTKYICVYMWSSPSKHTFLLYFDSTKHLNHNFWMPDYFSYVFSNQIFSGQSSSMNKIENKFNWSLKFSLTSKKELDTCCMPILYCFITWRFKYTNIFDSLKYYSVNIASIVISLWTDKNSEKFA